MRYHIYLMLFTFALTTTVAKSCACQVGLYTFASAFAFFLTSTVDQLITNILSLSKLTPYWPPLLVYFFPAPARRTLNVWFCLQAVSPDNASLVDGAPHMLFKCRLSWRDVFNGSITFSEQLLSCCVYKKLATCSVVQKNNKPFNCVHSVCGYAYDVSR